MTVTAPDRPGLYRLLAWLSPAFPTGAFSYSHGLETAAADGSVRDRATLEGWIAAIVLRGSGRIDAAILCDAYRGAATGDRAACDAAHRRGRAYRGTAELALESLQQGIAFEASIRAAWPAPAPRPAGGKRMSEAQPRMGEGPFPNDGACLAAAFGAAAAAAGIVLDDALLGYLQAFAANLVSAGLRLGLIGQTDGQRILAALEPAIAAAAAAALVRGPGEFGSATFAAELASIAHETQYTRLFRS